MLIQIIIAIAIALSMGLFTKAAASLITTALQRVVHSVRVESRFFIVDAGYGASPYSFLFRAIGSFSLVKYCAHRLRKGGLAEEHVQTARRVLPALLLLATIIWLLHGFLPFVGLVVLFVVSGHFWLAHRASLIEHQFIDQIPAFICATASGLSAGRSVQQAIDYAAQTAAQSARTELLSISRNLALGCPLDEAFEQLQRRFPSAELHLIITSLSIHSLAGGDLVVVMQKIGDALRMRRHLRRELEVETAQARLSARVIGAMPIVVTALIFMIDPAFMQPLLAWPSGISLLIAAAFMELAAFLMLKRILDIPI